MLILFQCKYRLPDWFQYAQRRPSDVYSTPTKDKPVPPYCHIPQPFKRKLHKQSTVTPTRFALSITLNPFENYDNQKMQCLLYMFNDHNAHVTIDRNRNVNQEYIF